MMKLRHCVETLVSQENGHFSLNNGSNSSWIRNSAIAYEKKNISLKIIGAVAIIRQSDSPTVW